MASKSLRLEGPACSRPEVRRRYGPCLACRSPRVRGAHASVAVASFGVPGGTYRGRHIEYFRTHLPAATRDWAGQCGRDRGSLALTGLCDWRLLRCRSGAAALTRRVIGGPGGPVENASVSIVVLKCVLKRPQKSPGLRLCIVCEFRKRRRSLDSTLTHRPPCPCAKPRPGSGLKRGVRKLPSTVPVAPSQTARTVPGLLDGVWCTPALERAKDRRMARTAWERRLVWWSPHRSLATPTQAVRSPTRTPAT
jgi:hypothetical protein